MNDLITCEWNNSIEQQIPVTYDYGQAAKEIWEMASNDAKRQLHPLLSTVELDRLDHRDEFLQAFKCALEKRTARKLVAWHPHVKAIFQFDERRIIDIQGWDGSIHLLVKVPRLSNALETSGRKLDNGLVRHLTHVGWQRFRTCRSILDVQQVTISELRHAVGYGAMFCAMYTAPIQLWPQYGLT